MDDGWPIFSQQADDGSIWTAVLEKVWAKVSGNYDLTTAGYGAEAVEFLTGAPSSTNFLVAPYGVPANAWAITRAAYLAGSIMTTSA